MKEKQRRKFSGEEKVAILKLHLVSMELVSDICDELNILPNQFYWWEKDAIIRYFINNPTEGYRRLAYMMLDKDVIAVRPASV